MGFNIKKISAPKITLPKKVPSVSSVAKVIAPGVKVPTIPNVKIPSAPKITVGDPTKLVTKPIEGIYNATGTVAQSAVSNVGKVLQTPGSAEVIKGAGTVFGIPPQVLDGIGTTAFDTQAKQFMDRKADFPSDQSFSSMPQTQNFGGGSNNMLLIFGGIAALGAILFFALKRK
jgi:hypothetical protein